MGRPIALLALLFTLAAPAAASATLPVPYDVSAVVLGGTKVNGSPAGANDWSCKPDAEHPRPVVLVHGLAATAADNWPTMSPLLKNDGFCVFALTYGQKPGNPYFGGFQPMERSAEELKAFVERVLTATGAKQVDLVGHSEGTVMPRWWLGKLGGARFVHRYVMLTPLWDGTAVGDPAFAGTLATRLGAERQVLDAFDAAGCGSCAQFGPSSSYLAAVNEPDERPIASIDYTSIVTRYDELVVPYTSGLLRPAPPNVRQVTLQDGCEQDTSKHLAVAYSPRAAQIVLNALAPERARPVPCALTTPAGTPNPPHVGLDPITPKVAGRCSITVRLPRRRGERITRAVALVGGRRSAARRGRDLRALRVPSLRPGRTTIRLRLTTRRGTRTATVRRSVGC